MAAAAERGRGARACGRWWASTTAGCPRSPWPAQLVAEGRLGHDPARAGAVPPGLARRPGVPADLAAAAGAGRLRRAGRHRRAHRRPRPVPHRGAADRGLRAAPRPSCGSGRCRRRVGGLAGVGGGRATGAVTVDDAALFTAGSPPARSPLRGHPVRHRPQERAPASSSTARGCLAFDFEALNELHVLRRHRARRRPPASAGSWSPSPSHPYLAAWWPPGHILGYEHTLHPPGRRPGRAIADGRRPDAVVRRRAAGAAGAGRRRGERRATGSQPGPSRPDRT